MRAWRRRSEDAPGCLLGFSAALMTIGRPTVLPYDVRILEIILLSKKVVFPRGKCAIYKTPIWRWLCLSLSRDVLEPLFRRGIGYTCTDELGNKTVPTLASTTSSAQHTSVSTGVRFTLRPPLAGATKITSTALLHTICSPVRCGRQCCDARDLYIADLLFSQARRSCRLAVDR